MWVTLMLWTSASLWSGSYCIAPDKVNPDVKPDSGESNDQIFAELFGDYEQGALSPTNSPEELVEYIFKSIENYHESSNSSTHKNDTKNECEEITTRVVILETLINSIFISIKNYKQNTKNATDTINNTPQNSNGNLVINNNQSNNEITLVSVNCTCVMYYKCNDSVDPDIIIITRHTENECSNYLQVCCYNIVELEEPTTIKNLATQPVSDLPTLGSTMTKSHSKCGQSSVLTNRSEVEDDRNDKGDRAEYGEFPWMAWIGDSSHTYLCGGSLIHPKVILTAAHCVNGKDNLVVRVGEWNTQSQTNEELFPHQEVKVKDILVHEKFNNGSLANDPALLILETAVELSDRVGLICLTDNLENVDGQQCIASGWGHQLKSNESEEDKTVLKRVGPLPIVPRDECVNLLRKTKLGGHFKLHETFICAGGNPGKDTCKGDGGSPLVCPSTFNSSVYVQVGIVAWGISCGTDTPGVYVNVPYFFPWIRDALKTKGIQSDF